MLQIAEWVKKIIAILVLAGFLEMILPNNELKSVTKMMMGLLIILVLVQPVFKIFKFPADILNSVPAIVETSISAETSRGTAQIIKNGQLIRDSWNAELQKHHQEMLAEKIKSSVELIEGVKLRDLKLEYQNSGLPEYSGIHRLKKVILRVEFNNSVEKHSLTGGRTARKTQQQSINRRIRDTIKLYGNFTDDQIEVSWNG